MLKVKMIALQLFWEKRLEGMRACDPDGYEFEAMDLPKTLKPVGPYITEETLLQSVATALHLSSQPVTGQTESKSSLEKNPGVFLNPDQPLVQVIQSIFIYSQFFWILVVIAMVYFDFLVHRLFRSWTKTSKSKKIGSQRREKSCKMRYAQYLQRCEKLLSVLLQSVLF